jgi:hypothetical protein
MVYRKKAFDGVERSRLDDVDHYWRRQHRDPPRTDKGGRVFSSDLELCRPDEAGEGREIHHRFWLSSNGLLNNNLNDSIATDSGKG